MHSKAKLIKNTLTIAVIAIAVIDSLSIIVVLINNTLFPLDDFLRKIFINITSIFNPLAWWVWEFLIINTFKGSGPWINENQIHLGILLAFLMFAEMILYLIVAMYLRYALLRKE